MGDVGYAMGKGAGSGRGAEHAAAALTAVAAGMAVAGSLVPQFGEGPGLLGEGAGAFRYVPELVLVVAAAGMMPFRRTFGVAAGLVVAYAPFAWSNAVGDIEFALSGQGGMGPGFVVLRTAHVLLVMAAVAAFAALARGGWPRSAGGGPSWAVAGACLALLGLLGEWLPWVRTTTTWSQDGERVSDHLDCCTLFKEEVGLPASVSAVAAALVAAGMLALAAFTARRDVSAGLALGVACWLLPDILSSTAQQLTWEPGDPETLRQAWEYDVESFRLLEATESQSLLPGMWITTVSVVGMLLFAAGRARRTG
ncbi:hypothetical protein [Actinocorallia populi]|uniref:hypothetical protein n=1 Tax=Actinocorallia populi TaxID=2079200 RepID=UPI000D092998|nr:hypothetical protein [Actinocorallia populi]